MPVAHREAEPRSAARRAGRERDRELRRLRPVRRGRACGGAVPLVLSRRADPERERVGPPAASCAAHGDRVALAARGGGVSTRPFTLLIAALGGEGGGVLTDWIVSAAEASGLPVQSTSIPGVAQRTGATTYYIEIYPVPQAQLGGRRPVLALAPGVGDLDLVVASELLEAGRAISSGFVTADRTLLLASTSRVYLTVEKMQMADGRYDSERLIKAVEQNAKEHLLFDMEAAAKQAGAIVNSVMLGAIAGSGRLPIPADAFEDAIKTDGKAVESNLRGFRAGLAAARDQLPVPLARPGKRPGKATLADLEAEASTFPEVARAFATEG